MEFSVCTGLNEKVPEHSRLGWTRENCAPARISGELVQQRVSRTATNHMNHFHAAASHLFVNDTIGETLTPVIVLSLAIASYVLRPAERSLAGPWL